VERIVKFITGYKSYITFLVCLFLSTLLLLSNNSAQILTLRSILIDASTSVSEPFKQFFQVFTALEDNKHLRAENIRLTYENSLFQQQKREIERLKEILQLKEGLQYEMKAGSIVGWSSVPTPSTVTINLGAEDGVKKNDPVISNEGLVGKILSTGEKSSVCQLMTDRNFKVSAIIRETGAFGLLQWHQDDIAIMEVQKSLIVNEGDTVVTSVHGNIYPEGILIGIVDSYYDGPELFKIVKVKLFVDYLQLHDIAIIIEK